MQEDTSQNNSSKNTNQSQEEELQNHKTEVTQSAKSFIGNSIAFLKDVVSLKHGLDYTGTAERIEENIKFQGVNVWVLICSIFIASVGLNANSPAVVIGAMLISPLMGPIMGIGFALGTYEFDLLKRSFTNFGVMIVISLITSTFYFLITPIDKPDTELFNRISPSFLDVLVAIFGGLAGIIAGSRKGVTNVIQGVAIATALMPPLCTAGYGLATLQFDFFLGAGYLFLLNSVFISLSTTIFARVLKFPKHTFVSSGREKKVRVYLFILTIVLVAPSVMALINLTRSTIFKSNATEFIKNEIKYKDCYVIKEEAKFDKESPTIDVYLGGHVPLDVVDLWVAKLGKYDLKQAKLNIIQDNSGENFQQQLSELQKKSSLDSKSLELILMNERNKIAEKDSLITKLNHKIDRYTKLSVDVKEINKEIKVLFPKIKKVAYASMYENYNNVSDTIPLMFVEWEDKTTRKHHEEMTKIENWIRVKQKNERIKVLPYTFTTRISH